MKPTADNRLLLGLFRILALLILIAYLGTVTHLWYATLAETRASLAYINSMLAQGVRTTLKGHELVLRGLGHELVRLGSLQHPEQGRELIERMRHIDPGMAGFGLAGPDGQLVLVSGIAPGKALPNLAHRQETRDSFAEVVGNHHLRTGRPYYFDELGSWVVPIRVAIRDEADSLIAVMTAGYTIDDATAVWTDLDLPPQVAVSLMRSDGYQLYSQPLPAGPREQALRSAYGAPLADDTLQRAFDRNGHDARTVYLPGGSRFIMYTHVPEHGLHTTAAVPRAAVIQDWLRKLVAPSLLLLLFLAASTLAYRHANRRQNASDAEIRRLTAWQQAMLDGADYGVVSTDTQGVIATFNKAAQRMLGYRPEEVVGKHTPEIIHDRDEIKQHAAELSSELGREINPGFEVFVAKARHGRSEEREWSYVRKDGSRLPVLLSVTPMTAPDGDIIGFLGISDDLSEQKAIRANLRDSEARYRAVFEHAGDAILLLRNGRFVECNPAALEMFGSTREQFLGSTPEQFSPRYQPDQSDSASKAREKLEAASQGGTQFFEWQHLRRDGSTFDVEVTLNRLEIAGESYVQATVRDVSERKRNELELVRSRKALIERNDSLRLLNRLSQRLHGTKSIDDILHETIQALLGLDHTPQIGIYLLDEGRDQLRLAENHDFDPALISLASRVPYVGSLSELALTRAAPVACLDVTSDDHVHPDLQAALRTAGVESGIFIPMICQSELLGSIVLMFKKGHQIAEISQETLLSLSNTVALAITNARQVENLEFQASHDSLTGLPNRTFLHRTLLDRQQAAGAKCIQSTLMLLDLDRFKDVNDTLGHHIGDQVLTQIGPRLELACQGQEALIARLGGDEFAILLDQGESTANAAEIAQGVVDSLRLPFVVEGVELHIGASIGVAYSPDHGDDSHSLLRAADVAMYQAKKLSAGIMTYNHDFDDYSAERLALANELAQAAQLGQLVLHYQPKIDIGLGHTVGYEALVRWQHPRLGLLYPGDFIELVEVGEVIHLFTRAVMEIAVADKRRLKDLGYDQPVAINLSANNLVDTRCFTHLMEVVSTHDLPCNEIELELTETALMHDQQSAAMLLRQFSEVGVNIAIDDFGTGYSSLSYLRQLPITALKIDRSFVTDMLTNSQDSTIVRSTIALAHNLSLDVIAEGVEDQETLEMLRTMGCDQAQGFGLCRPQPIDQLVGWLADNSRSRKGRKGS